MVSLYLLMSRAKTVLDRYAWSFGSISSAAANFITFGTCMFAMGKTGAGEFAIGEYAIMMASSITSWGGRILLMAGNNAIDSKQRLSQLLHIKATSILLIPFTAPLIAVLCWNQISLQYLIVLTSCGAIDALFQVRLQQLRLQNDAPRFALHTVGLFAGSIGFLIPLYFFRSNIIYWVTSRAVVQLIIIGRWIFTASRSNIYASDIGTVFRQGMLITPLTFVTGWLANGPRIVLAWNVGLGSVADFVLCQRCMAIASIGYTMPQAAIWVARFTESYRNKKTGELVLKEQLGKLLKEGVSMLAVNWGVVVFAWLLFFTEYRSLEVFTVLTAVAFVQVMLFIAQVVNLVPYIKGPVHAALTPYTVGAGFFFLFNKIVYINSSLVLLSWCVTYAMIVAVIRQMNRDVMVS